MSQKSVKGTIQLGLVIMLMLGIYKLNDVFEYAKTQPKINQQASGIPIVQTKKIAEVSWQYHFSETARIMPRTKIPITPEITGRIKNLSRNFVVGKCFAAHEVLFTIDTDEVLAEYQAAEASVKQAKATYALTKAEADVAVQEWRLLEKEKEIPPLVAKVPQLEQAKATIDAAIARMNLAKIRMNNSQFSLPFSGCVLESSVEAGQFAARGQSLGQVYAHDALEIIVNLSKTQADIVNASNFTADFYDSDDKKMSAKISHVSHILNDQTQFVAVTLRPQSGSELFPNQSGNVTFTESKPRKIFILSENDIDAQQNIMLVNAENKIEYHKVDILAREQDKLYVTAFASEIALVHGSLKSLPQGTLVKIMSPISKKSSL